MRPFQENIIVGVWEGKKKAEQKVKNIPKNIDKDTQREKAESDSFYFDLTVVLGLLSENSKLEHG